MAMLNDRLNAVMHEYELLTMQDLAEFLGVSKGLVSQWFNGTTGLGKKPLLALDKKTNFSTRWIIDGSGSKYKDEQTLKYKTEDKEVSATDTLKQLDDKYSYIPHYEEIVFTGDEHIFRPLNYTGQCIPFATSRHTEKNLNDTVCFSIAGNSMSPVLPEGATIAIKLGNCEITDGLIYAFKHAELFRIKLLTRLPGNQVRIKSYNSIDYPDEIVNLDTLEIIGEAFGWQVYTN